MELPILYKELFDIVVKTIGCVLKVYLTFKKY